jgi:hypothetical protein
MKGLDGAAVLLIVVEPFDVGVILGRLLGTR